MADKDSERGDEPVREQASDSRMQPEPDSASAAPSLTIAGHTVITLDSGQEVRELKAGQVAIIGVTFANRGPLADTLSLAIEGPQAEWVTLPQATVSLAAQQQVSISLVMTIPGGAAGHAGVYMLTLRAFSKAYPGELGEAQLCWVVAPLLAALLSLTPQQQRGRGLARFTVSVANIGNVPVRYTLDVEDNRRELDLALDQPVMEIEPAHTLHAPLSVRVGRPRLTSTVHTLTVKVEAPGLARQTTQARFIQAPFIPIWAPIAMLVALLVVLCGLGQLPDALAGRLPFYRALVALPTPTSSPDSGAVANLVAIRSESQRNLMDVQARLAALETSVAAVPSVARQAAQTSVAGAPALARRAVQTAVAVQEPTSFAKLLTAVSVRFPATGDNSQPATPIPDAPASGEPPPQSPAQGSPAPPAPAPTTVVAATPLPSLTPSPTSSPTPSPTSSPTPSPTPSITPTPLPELTINDVSIKEGTGEAVTLLFSVQLSQYSDQPVTVEYTTVDGTAHAPADYLSASGELTIESNTSLKTISISVIGNTKADGDRTFSVVLSNPTQATLSRARPSRDSRANGIPIRCRRRNMRLFR